MSIQNRQQGGSGIGLIIMLAILAYGVFIAIQYVPQYIEAATVKNILDYVADEHKKETLKDEGAIRTALDKQLYINEMYDQEDNFKVTQYRGNYTVSVSYERELNLLYTNKVMRYEKSVTLE